MIKRYQNLLNECIDLYEWKNKHKEMKRTLRKMKNKLMEVKKDGVYSMSSSRNNFRSIVCKYVSKRGENRK